MTEKTAEKDALKAFVEVRKNEIGPKFASGEHVWLGLMGLDLACRELGLKPSAFRHLRRLHDDDTFNYGELVALSGDFYGTPEALFEEEPALLPWLYEGNDLSDLRNIFGEELAWIEQENRHKGVAYPENSVALAWNAKSYVELALDNADHFAWHNIVAYVRYHGRALTLARQAGGMDNKDPIWRRALFYNAFADHFLTDGFAAGHVRIPRAQINQWALRRGYSKKLGGGLSKLLHDQDGHISTLHSGGERIAPDEGLHVLNSLDQAWHTRCDGQLFLARYSRPPHIDQPVRAVASSVIELIHAARKQELPQDVYQAILHVPFPHPDSKPLGVKFGPDVADETIRRMVHSISWYVKVPWIGPGVDEEKVRKLFNALPALMDEFRGHIAQSYDSSDELQKRLPAPYVTAFKAIR